MATKMVATWRVGGTCAICTCEAELKNFISNDNCVKWEEETTAVEVNTIAKLTLIMITLLIYPNELA